MRISLDFMRNLKKGWNCYDAEPLRNEFISEVEDLIEKFPYQPMHIFPTACSSIQCEWESRDLFLEIEIFDSPRYAKVFTDRMEKEGVEDGVKIEMADIFSYINEFIIRHTIQDCNGVL